MEIFDQYDDEVEEEDLNELNTIEFFKCDEQLWKNGIIRLVTASSVPYFEFEIEAYYGEIESPGPLSLPSTGRILEIWHWDEKFQPLPVIYPDFSNWQNELITIKFNDREENSSADGKIIRNTL